jgi:hypothetical protein
MELARLMRPAAVVAGPAAAVALALLVVGLVTEGEAGVETSPLAIASSSLLLVALVGIGAAALAALGRFRDAGRGTTGAVVALLGTVLVVGGGGAPLFVLPALAESAPAVLESGLPSVQIGYIASYVVFTIGWVWTGVGLLRARLVPTWLGVLVAVCGALAFVPAPEAFRLLPIAVAASLVARRLAVATPGRQPVLAA